MNIINLFLIILILYLIYKVAVRGEKFQDTIDLSDVDIINSKNIFMNIDESRLEEINKIPELDLSKNNLIIDNRYGNKVSISNKLCVGNYCINSEKLKTLTGEIDGPQFYKHNTQTKTDTPKYYNHDCGIGVDNSNSFKCDIDKEIDYPDKLCFNYLDNKGTKKEPTCIGPDEFDVLKGVRGIKLKHTESNTEDPTGSAVSAVSNYGSADPTDTNPKYMTPYYMDFKQSGNGIEGTKDQLFFKNNDECLGKELLKYNNVDLNDMNYRDILRFTQENANIFNKDTVYDYGRSGKGIRLQSGTLKDINNIIEGLWLTYMTLGAPLGWIAALTGAETGVFPSSVRTDIPNIETIIADIKTEYNENWWIKGENVKKFPYFKDSDHEINCEDVDCDTDKKFMCPHKCRDEIKADGYCKSIYSRQGGCLDASNIVMIDGDDGSGNIGHSPHIHTHALDSNGNITNSKFTHGYYILNNEFDPDDLDDTKHKTIDPDYNGYYLSKLNNNTKYKIKENAISRVSKFLGANLNTHRITGDSKECSNIDELSNTQYYCSGKNGGESDKEYLCNPVKYKIDNIIKCVNDKVADAADEDDTVGKVYTKLSEITDTTDPTLNDYYNECIGGEPDQVQGQTTQAQGQTTISQGPVPTQGSKNSQTEIEINPSENYVMTPAKDADGNDIKANTYFHGHSHIH